MKIIGTGNDLIRKAIMALVSLTSITAQAGDVWFRSGSQLFFSKLPLSQAEFAELSEDEKLDLLKGYDVWEFEDLTYKGYDGYWDRPRPLKHFRPGTFTDGKRKDPPRSFDPKFKNPTWTEKKPVTSGVLLWTNPPSQVDANTDFSSSIWTERGR